MRCACVSFLYSVCIEYVKFYVAADNAPKSTSGGFASLTATSTEMTVTFYDQDGNVQYVTPPIAPRV